MNEELLKEWHVLQHNLKSMKAREMLLRKQIVEEVQFVNDKMACTFERYGIELKATKKITYNIDKLILDSEFKTISTEEMKAIKWTPSIIIKAYNELPGDCVLKRNIVTVNPAAPTLTVVSILED